MKRLLALSSLSIALLLGAGAARADVAPPNSTECNNSKAGDPCVDDTMKAGACESQTCSHLVYGGDAGPTTAETPCLICVAGAQTTHGGCSLPASSGREGWWLAAALALPFLLRRRAR